MRNLFLLAITAVLAISCAEKQPQATITGIITNAPDRDIYVSTPLGMLQSIPVDTIKMVDGKFTYTTTDVYPRAIQFQMHDDIRRAVKLVIEEGNITITGEYDEIEDATLSGTLAAEKLSELAKKTKPSRVIQVTALEEFKALDSYKGDDKNEKSYEINNRYSKAYMDAWNITQDFGEANTDNFAGVMILTQWDPTNYASATEALEKISTNLPANAMVDRLKEFQARFGKTAPGSIAPNFSAKTIDGEVVNLSDYKGKVVLIDFWASWCTPCRKAIPSVKKTYDKYKDKGFVVIGVSIDTDKDAWVKASEEEKLEWVNVSNLTKNCPATSAYDVVAVPTTFLIDKDGRIATTNPHGEQLDVEIEKIL